MTYAWTACVMGELLPPAPLTTAIVCRSVSCRSNLSCCCDRVSFIVLASACCVVGSSSALLQLGSSVVVSENGTVVKHYNTRARSIGVW